jgi:hypothetical protein
VLEAVDRGFGFWWSSLFIVVGGGLDEICSTWKQGSFRTGILILVQSGASSIRELRCEHCTNCDTNC